MSKTAQRAKARAHDRKKRFEHGQKMARDTVPGDPPVEWYPRCMAWRKGFLSAGGNKFWLTDIIWRDMSRASNRREE